MTTEKEQPPHKIGLQVTLEQLTESVLQTEEDMRFANQLARTAGERVKASALSMQSSASVLEDLNLYMQRLDQVFDELGSQSMPSVRLSAASRTLLVRPACWRSMRQSRRRGRVAMAGVCGGRG